MMNRNSILEMWDKIEKWISLLMMVFTVLRQTQTFFENSYGNLNYNGYCIIEDIHRKPSNIKKFYYFFKKEN